MPTEYIHFTTEQKDAAWQTDLVALLQSQGEHLKRSGREYVWWDGSDKVTIRGNLWFHQYERIGGGQAQQDSPRHEPQRTPPHGSRRNGSPPIRTSPPKKETAPDSTEAEILKDLAETEGQNHEPT